jgi:hypothetical protein
MLPGYHDFAMNLQDPIAPLLEIPFTWHRGQIVSPAPNEQ